MTAKPAKKQTNTSYLPHPCLVALPSHYCACVAVSRGECVKMEALKGPLTFFFPGDCYQEVVVNHNILNGEHSVFVCDFHKIS